MTLEERWARIDRLPGLEFSELGRVRGPKGIRRLYKAEYYQCTLRLDGRSVAFQVHAAVAEAFLGPCPPGLQVAHENGDRYDNRLANLSYKTVAENNADKHRHGTAQFGERGVRALLTEGQVLEIRERLAAGERGKDLAEEFRVDAATISAIKTRRNWTHL